MYLPCRIEFVFRRSAICNVSDLERVAAPEYSVCRLDKSYLSTKGCFAKKLTSGGAISVNVPCNDFS